jgi:threonine synthase
VTPFTTPRPATWQACLACGTEYLETNPRTRCECGGLLEVRHRPPDAGGEELRGRLAGRLTHASGPEGSGVWRYRELVLPGATDAEVVSHPEGNTPLLTRPALAGYAGLDELLVKHEGHNPTGSFKDRGMTVGVTQARRIGATAVACASTGNTAASLAAYAGQAGLPAVVLVPAARVAAGKLAQTLAYGARALEVDGDFDDCLRLLEAAARELGVYLLNSVNPFRVEGQKTIVLELLQQLGWDPPDWIVLPAGNLGNTSAFGKALVEARAWGLIGRLPRLAAVQAAGAAPFARGFEEGFAFRHRVKAETIATAIRIGDPASWDRAVQAIRATDGVVTAVSDEAILEAKATIDATGVGCEPASAASVAGARQLAAAGVIARGARVVAVLTGHLLKDPEVRSAGPDADRPAGPQAHRPVPIAPTLDALAAALRRR